MIEPYRQLLVHPEQAQLLARMVTALPRVHVAVMGVEKIVPSMTELVVFLAILAWIFRTGYRLKN